jgi:vitamin B12 transporter
VAASKYHWGPPWEGEAAYIDPKVRRPASHRRSLHGRGLPGEWNKACALAPVTTFNVVTKGARPLMFKSILKCSAAITALVLFHSASAQEQVGEAVDCLCNGVRMEKDIVVTANGTVTPRKETGQAITVIDRAVLEAEQSVSIAEILRTVPSVTFAANGGIGAATSVFIRGGESAQTLVLIDGVRINDPSSPNSAFDFGALLTGNIDQVEILRGPNSVIWGSQAMGGVISIRNAEPGRVLATNALAEYGSFDTAQARVNVSGRTGIVSGSIGGGYFRTGGISALSAGTERDGYENYSANGKLKVEFSEAFEVDLRGYYNKGRVEFDDPFGAGPDTFPVTNNEQFIGYVGLNSSVLDGRLKQRVSYSRTQISRVGSEADVEGSFNVNYLKGEIDRFEYAGSFAAADAATLIFGAEHERSRSSSFFPAGGGAGPDLAKYLVTSGYGQLVVKPLSGLTLTGGVRYDDYSEFGGQTTFAANFAYSPNGGNTVLRGTYAEGFRAPSLTEALPPFGNAALKPETAKSYDAGIEHHLLDDKVTASATYFYRKSNDTIAFSFVSFQSENIARTRAEGVEIVLALRPTNSFSVNAHYSIVEATNRSAGDQFGNRLARRPKDSASLSADWKTPLGLALGSTVTITGDSFNDAANNVRLDSYVWAGLRASYPVTDKFELYTRVDNLFDEAYETVRTYGTYGRGGTVGIRAKF